MKKRLPKIENGTNHWDGARGEGGEGGGGSLSLKNSDSVPFRLQHHF